MAENKDTVTLIVNAREKVVSSSELSPDGEISFDEVVKLAFETPPSGQYIMFTVMFRKGAGRPPDGILIAGQSVKVQDGTVFDVALTDKS